MSKWITDRLPTFDDADDQGDVYTLNGVLQRWDCIADNELWCPLPKAPEPYEHLVNKLLEAIDEMHDGEADWSEVWKARKALR